MVASSNVSTVRYPSLRGFLQDQLLERQISDGTAKAPVLALEILQTPGLVQLQTAVLPAPSVVTLLRHADVTTDLSACLPRARRTSASRK